MLHLSNKEIGSRLGLAETTVKMHVSSLFRVFGMANRTRLVAAVFDGQLHTSSDAGVSWTARESSRFWNAVASSADGERLLAAGGQLYTSALVPRESTTLGVAGSVGGRQYAAITLQYAGGNKFVVFDFMGGVSVE